jgi:hypothetical protein
MLNIFQTQMAATGAAFSPEEQGEDNTSFEVPIKGGED